MRLRYYLDPATDEPHIYGHNVSEDEEVLENHRKIELAAEDHALLSVRRMPEDILE